MQQIITFIGEERASHGEQGNRLTSPAHWFFCPCRSSHSPSDAGCPIDDQLQPGLWRSPLCVWPHQPRVKKSAQISLRWPVNWLQHSGPNRWPWYINTHNLHKLKYISPCLLSHLFTMTKFKFLYYALCSHIFWPKYFQDLSSFLKISFVYNVPIFWINRFKGIVHR